MRTKSILTSCAFAVLVSGTALVSCQKNLDKKSTNATDSKADVVNFASMQTIANLEDMQQLAFALNPSTISAESVSGTCPPVTTYDNPPGIYPRTVTIDWGTGCTNSGGVTRSGKTITTYTGDLADTGNMYTLTYDNFYINGVKIEGQTKMAHNPRTNDPQVVYRANQVNRKVIQTNGDYIIYNGFRRIVKKEDDGETPGFPDGYFKVTGIVAGDEVKGGVSYQWRDSIDKDKPLIYKYCSFITKGKLYYEFTGNPSATSWSVDYGTGNCDDQATLSIDGGAFIPVTLPLAP